LAGRDLSKESHVVPCEQIEDVENLPEKKKGLVDALRIP